MNGKPVVPRVQAFQDIQDALNFYLEESAEVPALRFVDALERAFRHIGRHPASGSPRFAHDLDLPGLRSWPVARHPHLVFYLERDAFVDVWRVLHAQRDLPAQFTPA